MGHAVGGGHLANSGVADHHGVAVLRHAGDSAVGVGWARTRKTKSATAAWKLPPPTWLPSSPFSATPVIAPLELILMLLRETRSPPMLGRGPVYASCPSTVPSAFVGIPTPSGRFALANAPVSSLNNSDGVTHVGGPYYKAMEGAGEMTVGVAGGLLQEGTYLNNQIVTDRHTNALRKVRIS